MEALFELGFDGTIYLNKVKDIVLNEIINITLFEADPDTILYQICPSKSVTTYLKTSTKAWLKVTAPIRISH